MAKVVQKLESWIQRHYVLDAGSRCWMRSNGLEFGYSDGDEVENRIKHIVDSATDLGSTSMELRNQVSDWPSAYHLHPRRSNLLRPLESVLKGRILEIGAGCGAITRYLGERGAVVHAVEGGVRRAAIAAARCRDQKNVTVIVDSFDLLPAPAETYDVVTIIGVLEYARIYFPTALGDPVDAMLSHARRYLRPGGILVLAVENQMGLKYFAGYGEDHLGQTMVGIEDRYSESGVVTFGRQELAHRLSSAGFAEQRWWFPFPDYKLPVSVLSEQWADRSEADNGAIVSSALAADFQEPVFLSFSLEQASQVVCRNGLAGELANSFLVVASGREIPAVPEILGYHFAVDRRPEFAKEIRFERHADEIRVAARRLVPKAPADPESPLTLSLASTETFAQGRHWQQELYRIVNKPGWGLDEIVVWARMWFSALLDLSGVRTRGTPLSASLTIPGDLFDALPRNLIVGSNDEPHFFDQEWRFSVEMEIGYMLHRGVLISLLDLRSCAAPSDRTPLRIVDLFREVAKVMGVTVMDKDLERYLEMDNSIAKWALGRILHTTLDDIRNRFLPSRTPLDRIPQLQACLSQLNEQAVQLHDKLTELNGVLSDRDRDIAHFNESEDKLKKAVAERDNVIAQLESLTHELNQALGERDRTIGQFTEHSRELNTALSDRDRTIAQFISQVGELNQVLIERDRTIAHLNARTGELSQAVAERGQSITQLDETIVELNARIDEFKHTATERDALIAATEAMQVERDHHIAALNHELALRQQIIEGVIRSRSWRLTIPVRFAGTTLRKVREAFARIRYIYRLLRTFPLDRHVQEFFSYRAFPWMRRTGDALKTRLMGQSEVLHGAVQASDVPAVEPSPVVQEHAVEEPIVIGAGSTVAEDVLVLKDAAAELESHPNGRSQLLEEVFREMLSYAGRFSPRNGYVPRGTDGVDADKLDVKAVAFYLPQFHPIPENDEWWGKGFTEWTNVSKALPRYVGHYQPHLPGELGFYDLRVPEVMRQQVDLARQYGIYGFCFYHYWFNGKRLLEGPLNRFLADQSLDLKFCLCWANENWSRRWDGLEKDILIAQNHSPEDDVAFLKSLAGPFSDRRHIRIDEKPVLLVYRASLLPDAEATARRWRECAKEMGLPGLYLVAVRSFDVTDPRSFGFDAAVEFPPLQINLNEVTAEYSLIDPGFEGHVYSYAEIVDKSIALPETSFRTFKTVMPSWDNEPRRPGAGFSFAGATPELFAKWLMESCRKTMQHRAEERFVFVNAWNEWAEGAHLEPDRKYGYAYLHASANVFRYYHNDEETQELITEVNARFTRTADAVIIFHCHYEDLIAPIFDQYFTELQGADLFVTVRSDINKTAIEEMSKRCPNIYFQCQENRGRDVRPFLIALRRIRSLGYTIGCKVHTKKTPHWERNTGEWWRQQLMEPLLGSSDSASRAAQIFAEKPATGLLAPDGSIMNLAIREIHAGNTFWLDRVLDRLGRNDLVGNYAFNFPAGSMYWFRVDALAGLDDVILEEDAFEQELGQLDGTLAHALERLVAFYAEQRGYGMEQIYLHRKRSEPLVRMAIA